MMTKHIALILILASLLASCQRRELVGNLGRMPTGESRPEDVIKKDNTLDTIWKVGLTAAVVFLVYKNRGYNKKMHYLNKANRRLQTAYDNFKHMFGFHQEDAVNLNNMHVQL